MTRLELFWTVTAPFEVSPEVAVISPEMVGVAVQAVPVTVRFPPKEVRKLPETVKVLSRVVAPCKVSVPGVVTDPMVLILEAPVPRVVLPLDVKVVNAPVPAVVAPTETKLATPAPVIFQLSSFKAREVEASVDPMMMVSAVVPPVPMLMVSAPVPVARFKVRVTLVVPRFMVPASMLFKVTTSAPVDVVIRK